MNILNVITQILSYADPCATDNPQLRSIDWTRRFNGISAKKPESDSQQLAPGESFTVFDGSRSTSLAAGTSVLKIELINASQSRYRMTVTSGPAGFRAARAVSGITGCVVAVNNNSVASFAFAGATLTGVVVGDTMRVKGAATYDVSPYAFAAANAGLWRIIGVSGTTVQAVRLPGQAFSGTNQTVASATADVEFYSAAGVQAGDTMLVSGTFAQPSQRAYSVADVTPTTIDFVSTMPIPTETGLTYVADSITFYMNAKKLVYIEVDQEAVVRFNEDASDSNRVSPVVSGAAPSVGYLHKYGDSYRIVVVNKSINTMNVKFFLAE